MVTGWEALGYASYGGRYPHITGTCFICGDPDTVLVIDHCHEHGWIRDRLCSPCNVRLGFIEQRERLVNFATIGSYSCDIIEHFTLCPDCSQTSLNVVPPHMRPNWRAGYHNEATRFTGPDTLRIRKPGILDILANLDLQLGAA